MTSQRREPDLTAFTARLSAALGRIDSSELGLRGLRLHANVAWGSTMRLATLDCSRRVPAVELGHTGAAHLVVYIDQSAIVPLLSAYSLRDVFKYFQAGLIRLQKGAPGQGPLYTILRMVRDPEETRDNAALRAELEAIFEGSARATET